MTGDHRGGPLSAFGIDEASEQVYRSVLRRPGVSPETLADQLGRPLDTVLGELEPLVDLRLVRRSRSGITADPPEFALGRLLNDHMRRLVDTENALSVARLEINNYVAEHLAGQRPGWQPVSIDSVPGSEIADVMQTLITGGSGEMLFLRPDQWLVPAGQLIDVAVARATREGRGSRVIYPATVIETRSELVNARAEAGELIRVLPSVPSRMAVFGTDAVILPETWGTTTGNPLLIRQPAIVSACIALFEQLWSHAVTVPGLGASFEGGSRRQLLELLARGVKDEHLARSLGISLRTVRRRIATVMAELGVDSRFQAGMEAVRRGWL